MNIKPEMIKRILIIRPDALGDLVLTLPAIHALKAHFPQAEITALVREYTAPLLFNNLGVSAIIHDFDLKKYNFDLSVNFFNEFKDTFAAFRARIPYRLGDSSRILTAWMNNLRTWVDVTSGQHRVEMQLELLKPLGVKPNAITTEPLISLSTDQKNYLARFCADYRIATKDLIIGVHPGIGKTSRAWPPEHYAKVIRLLLLKRPGAKVIMTGMKNEIPAADKIAQLANNRQLINLAGQTSLTELIALTSRYNLFISTDTGPLHLAAALKVPCVALFPTKFHKPSEWGPWGTRHLIVRKANQCPYRCVPSTCHRADCLKAITPEAVLSAAEKILAGGGVASLLEAKQEWAKEDKK